MSAQAGPAGVHNDAEAAAEIARIDAQAERHDVRYRGCTIRWRRFGADHGRAPLLLLHGGHGSWLHWLRNVEALAARRTVWVPDLPGYHDSDELPAADGCGEPLQRYADALIATADTLVGRSTGLDLAGFSFGALVAAHVGARRGGIDRMALLGTAGHGGARRQRLPMQDWRRAPDAAARRAALRHNLASLMLHGDAGTDALALAVHDRSCTRTRMRSRGLSRAGGLREALAAQIQPLLFIWGEHDVTAVPELLAEQLAAEHPARDWCLVPGAGHWVQYERANDVNAILDRWFSPASSPASSATTACTPPHDHAHAD